VCVCVCVCVSALFGSRWQFGMEISRRFGTARRSHQPRRRRPIRHRERGIWQYSDPPSRAPHGTSVRLSDASELERTTCFGFGFLQCVVQLLAARTAIASMRDDLPNRPINAGKSH
jgi:hypothetical protein